MVITDRDKVIYSEQMLYIGRRGEDKAVTIRFAVKDLIERFGEGTFSVTHQRAEDPAPYPCVTETDGDCVIWKPSSADTYYIGEGTAELRLITEDATVKQYFKTYTDVSHDEPGDPPEPWEAWVDQVIEAKAAIENMSASADVGDAEGVPAVTVTKATVDDHINFNFTFNGFAPVFVISTATVETGNWTIDGVVYHARTYGSTIHGMRKGDIYIDGQSRMFVYSGVWDGTYGYGLRSIEVKGAKGDPGEPGDDGISPHIGANGNWFIGETDTGVRAQGPQGDPGSDADVTAENIEAALGYEPADAEVVSSQSSAIAELEASAVKGVKVAGTELTKDADGKVDVPKVSSSSFGVVKPTNSGSGLNVNSSGEMSVNFSGNAAITSRSGGSAIRTDYLNFAVKSALSDANRISNMTDAEKDNACIVIGADRHKTQTITIASASWSNNSVTVSVEGVTADNLVFVSPSPLSLTAYGSFGVYASAQGSGTITFMCASTPTVAVDVQIVIWG